VPAKGIHSAEQAGEEVEESKPGGKESGAVHHGESFYLQEEETRRDICEDYL